MNILSYIEMEPLKLSQRPIYLCISRGLNTLVSQDRCFWKVLSQAYNHLAWLSRHTLELGLILVRSHSPVLPRSTPQTPESLGTVGAGPGGWKCSWLGPSAESWILGEQWDPDVLGSCLRQHTQLPFKEFCSSGWRFVWNSWDFLAWWQHLKPYLSHLSRCFFSGKWVNEGTLRFIK